jgi:hypothetical protein
VPRYLCSVRHGTFGERETQHAPRPPPELINVRSAGGCDVHLPDGWKDNRGTRFEWPLMVSIGASESKFHKRTTPSASEVAMFSAELSCDKVACGCHVMQLTRCVCPLSVRFSVHSGTDHNLHRPDHDAVARVLPSGENSHDEIGRLSPTYMPHQQRVSPLWGEHKKVRPQGESVEKGCVRDHVRNRVQPHLRTIVSKIPESVVELLTVGVFFRIGSSQFQT